MTRARKKVLFLATGLVLALPVLFLVEEHFRGKWRLAKYRAELLAKGEKLTIAECRPSSPEPADNGFDDFAYAASTLDFRSLSDLAVPYLRPVAPGKAQVVYNLDEWPLRSRAAATPSNSNWQIVEGLLDKSRASMEAARAALLKPRFEDRSIYLVNGQISIGTRAIRAANLCFNTDSLIRLHHGQIEESLNDLETCLRLSGAMGEQRTSMAQNFRQVVGRLTLCSTWQALQTPGWTDAQLARLQRAWETNDFLGPAFDAIEVGRAMNIQGFQRMREDNAFAFKCVGYYGSYSSPPTGQNLLDDLSQQLGVHGSQVLVRGLYIPLWQFAWSHEDERVSLEITQQLLENSRSARTQRSMKPALAASKQIESRMNHQSLFGNLRSFGSRAFLRLHLAGAAAMQAQGDLAITAIALKRYELKHRHLPPDLGALVPDFLAAPLLDIFDGQPLRYRPSGSGFLLYSIGKDETDDGGNPTGSDNANVSFFNGRDFVWPQSATDEEIKKADEKQRRSR